MLANRRALLFVRRSARKAWWRSGGLSSPPASMSSHSNRTVRAFSGLRCAPYRVRKEEEYFDDIPDVVEYPQERQVFRAIRAIAPTAYRSRSCKMRQRTRGRARRADATANVSQVGGRS